MGLHPNQTILSAVQEGTCSAIDDINPYETGDKKRYLGWQQGHENVTREHQQQQKYNESSLLRRLLCKIGLHKYQCKHIPGRPHINPKTGEMDRRDPIIKKYTCICCDYTYFVGL